MPPEPSGVTVSEPSGSAREENQGPKLSCLDEETRLTVEALLSVKGWDKPEAKTLELVADVRRTYPGVDALATATSLAFKVRTGAAGPYKKPSRTFANWAASDAARAAERDGDERPRARGRKRVL
ncbi:hypothetical protein GBA65_15070 [Rubrobacter marinus]|uniref:Uncharacterized protein n=1 Tax=Rubrobacter marinus TaxID=2653852 RepID=A0A6G8PZJ3_9ACTN|nr:hypothetical protein [Rubrobacter marinus]QIN79626.1 hypothetical protein GBA65_15070 [Rubrobacter marinus]